MNKLALSLVVLAMITGCVTTGKNKRSDTQQVIQKSYLGYNRADVEKEFGLPYQVTYENGNTVLAYWKDEGEFLGHVKYTFVLTNGRVAQFSKRPTSSKFKANLNEDELRYLNELYGTNRYIMGSDEAPSNTIPGGN